MMRSAVITLIVGCSLIIAGFGPINNSAQAAVSRLPIVLLVQRSYFVAEETGCRVDVDDQKQVLLKVNSAEGKRRGGAWFSNGETINATGPSDITQMYCAFVKAAEVETTGEAELLLHNVYLTNIDLNEYVSDSHIVLEVDNRGLVAESVATPVEVRALGLNPLTSVETDTNDGDASSTGVTRTPRTPDVTRTTRPNTTTSASTGGDPRSTRATTNTTTNPTNQRSGIVPGEWELEGETEWDFFFVSIDTDLNGTGRAIVEELDPLDFAVEMGVPLIGEGRAPEGCRVFAYSGPLGIPLFLGACADGEYVLFAYGTDKDVLDDTLEDFSNGEPFRVPFGYFEV